MSDSIIAVVPGAADVDAVQRSLSPDGIDVQFIRSLEEGLRLIAAGSTPVYVCDPQKRASWREPILRLLRSGAASRVVLLSRMASEAA
jgi:hypothetical protein